MIGQAIIGQTDISNLIVDDTYKMDAEGVYESWKDGNYVEHRIYTSSKIRGSFNVVLSSKNNCTLSQFKAIIDGATTNHVLLGAFYCTNTGQMEAVNAYCKLTNKDHILTADGSFIDIVTVEITER